MKVNLATAVARDVQIYLCHAFGLARVGLRRVVLLLAFAIELVGWLTGSRDRGRGLVGYFALRLAALLSASKDKN